MQLKHLLIFYAVLGVLFGIGFVAAPAQSLAAYGVTLGEPGLGITRLMGAAFIGIGLLAGEPATTPVLPLCVGSCLACS